MHRAERRHTLWLLRPGSRTPAIGLVAGLFLWSTVAAARGIPPAPQTDARAPVWRITFRASPDVIGAGGLPCPGCDGVITSADRWKAAGRPLAPVGIEITSADAGAKILTTSMQPVGNTGTVAYYFSTTSPPPYRVMVEGIVGPEAAEVYDYVLCPNSPQELTITQADFDRYSAAAPGRGRRYGVDWRFLGTCGQPLGGVICVIKCWLGHIGGPNGTPDSDRCEPQLTCPDRTPAPSATATAPSTLLTPTP